VIVFAAILVAGAVVLWVLHPLVTGTAAPLERVDDEPTEAESRKRVTLLALRDVEYDHATGKLDDEDYLALREELTAEAFLALQATTAAAPSEQESADPDELEREIAEYREALRAGAAGAGAPEGAGAGEVRCPGCGSAAAAGSRFCGVCGARLPEREGSSPG
jgi:hypothetical protein